MFKSVDEIKAFGEFFGTERCFIVAVYTPSQQSAFRVFSRMNSRGLDLLPTDIIKADIMEIFFQRNNKRYIQINGKILRFKLVVRDSTIYLIICNYSAV